VRGREIFSPPSSKDVTEFIGSLPAFIKKKFANQKFTAIPLWHKSNQNAYENNRN